VIRKEACTSNHSFTKELVELISIKVQPYMHSLSNLGASSLGGGDGELSDSRVRIREAPITMARF
jgi:hypothetical protein